jgi:tetratricopeptide (TPR) repeat protein
MRSRLVSSWLSARSLGAALSFAALVSVSALSACAPARGEGYLHAFTAGQRAQHAGRFDEAARFYGEAAKSAERVKDRDEALFLQGRALERAGRVRDARAVYEAMLKQPGPRTARAEFEIALLEIDHGDEAKGRELLFQALRRNPKHGLARNALKQLSEAAAHDGGEEARLAWLAKRGPELKGTDLEQLVEYETASTLERLGRTAEARDAFVATAARYPYPFGAYTDDALWHAALLEEELGRHNEAIGLLRKLLAPREVSTQMGSYERPRFSEAQLKIAKIYRDGLKDRAAARREFRKLYTDHKTSTLRDDALWAEAVLFYEDKEQDEACGVVKRLVGELPESRFARCARAVCPTAPEAKRPCADYILRDLSGGSGNDGGEGDDP